MIYSQQNGNKIEEIQEIEEESVCNKD